MDVCGIVEMKDMGKIYMWFNGYISSRIDGVFCNISWIINYGYIVVEFREFMVLDYILVVDVS